MTRVSCCEIDPTGIRSRRIPHVAAVMTARRYVTKLRVYVTSLQVNRYNSTVLDRAIKERIRNAYINTRIEYERRGVLNPFMQLLEAVWVLICVCVCAINDRDWIALPNERPCLGVQRIQPRAAKIRHQAGILSPENHCSVLIAIPITGARPNAIASADPAFSRLGVHRCHQRRFRGRRITPLQSPGVFIDRKKVSGGATDKHGSVGYNRRRTETPLRSKHPLDGERRRGSWVREFTGKRLGTGAGHVVPVCSPPVDRPTTRLARAVGDNGGHYQANRQTDSPHYSFVHLTSLHRIESGDQLSICRIRQFDRTAGGDRQHLT